MAVWKRRHTRCQIYLADPLAAQQRRSAQIILRGEDKNKLNPFFSISKFQTIMPKLV
jgi:hypothetical protein